LRAETRAQSFREGGGEVKAVARKILENISSAHGVSLVVDLESFSVPFRLDCEGGGWDCDGFLSSAVRSSSSSNGCSQLSLLVDVEAVAELIVEEIEETESGSDEHGVGIVESEANLEIACIKRYTAI
jgi:hypothetical protein